MNEDGPKRGRKTSNLEPLWIKNDPVETFITNQQVFPTSHTDAHDRLDDISTHHKPHFPQITSVFRHSHNMVLSTEERFAIERMATRRFGCKKIATTLGLPQSTTQR